jgi:hypothetical protein
MTVGPWRPGLKRIANGGCAEVPTRPPSTKYETLVTLSDEGYETVAVTGTPHG